MVCCDIVYLACLEGMVKNVNRLATNTKTTNEIFNELGHIMKDTLYVEVDDAIDKFFNKFVDEHNFLDYFHKNVTRTRLLMIRFVREQTLSSVFCFGVS